MAFNYTSTGGYFTRLGAIGGVLGDATTFSDGLSADANLIVAQYTADYQNQALVNNLTNNLVSQQSTATNFMSFLQGVGVNTTNYMIYAFDPLLSANNFQASMQQIIELMIADGKTVLKMNVGATSTALSTNGSANGVCIPTVYRTDGLTQECLIPESISVSCTRDSTSGITAGQERFAIQGTVPANNALSYNWPLGSGAAINVSAVSTASSASLIGSDGDFETWSGAVPNGWTILTGGGTISKSTAQHFTGTASMQIAGDGSTLTALEYPLSVSKLTLYTMNCWLKMSSTPAAGILTFSLVDGSGNVINDQQGNANTITKDLTGVSTTFVPVNGTFRTPYLLPTSVFLRIKLTTALSNTKNLFIDTLVLAQPGQLYTGGPSFLIASGSSPFYALNTSDVADGFTVATTNSFGVSNTLNTFQILAQRLFNLSSFGFQLPSSASPNINDNLITPQL